MQVCNFAENVLPVSQVSARPVFHRGGSQRPDHYNDGCRRSEHPLRTEPALQFRRNALFYPSPEINPGSEAFPGDVNRAFHLYTRKGTRRARGAAAHMGVEGAHLLLRKLTVE